MSIVSAMNVRVITNVLFNKLKEICDKEIVMEDVTKERQIYAKVKDW